MRCKQDLAYIPDNPDIYDYLTGIQYLTFIADIYGVSRTMRDERIKRYADAMSITGRLGETDILILPWNEAEALHRFGAYTRSQAHGARRAFRRA